MVKYHKKKSTSESYEDYIEDNHSDEENISDEFEYKQIKLTQKELNRAINLIQKGKKTGLKRMLRLYKKVTEESAIDESLELQIIESALKSIPHFFTSKLLNNAKSSKNWSKSKLLFRSFIALSLFLLKQSKSPEILELILSGLSELFPLSQLMKDYSYSILKETTRLWAEGEKSTKLLCYSFLRGALYTHLIDPILLLKMIYLKYAAYTKFLSWNVYENTELMQKCIVDLFGIDFSAGYQATFVYLRQLSLHLGEVIRVPSTDKVKEIYNWQFLNSLTLLQKIISHHSKEYKELANPFIELGCGLLKLTNIPKYFPYKLHVIRSLIAIEKALKIYIPGITPHLLEIIQTPSIYKRSKTTRLKAFSFLVAIKASKEQLSSGVYKEELVEECCEGLIEHLAAVAGHIGFVELAIPVRLVVKKLAKNMKDPNVRAKLEFTWKSIEENSNWVERKRTEDNLSLLMAPEYVSGDPPIVNKAESLYSQRQNLIQSRITET